MQETNYPIKWNGRGVSNIQSYNNILIRHSRPQSVFSMWWWCCGGESCNLALHSHRSQKYPASVYPVSYVWWPAAEEMVESNSPTTSTSQVARAFYSRPRSTQLQDPRGVKHTVKLVSWLAGWLILGGSAKQPFNTFIQTLKVLTLN